MLKYKLSPIYTKGLDVGKYHKVRTINSLRDYKRLGIFLYDDNKPNTKPFNMVKLYMVSPRDGLNLKDIKIISEAELGELPSNMITIGEYHVKHGKRIV